MAKLTKSARTELLTTAASVTAAVAGEIEDRAASPDPIESARAMALLIEARNNRDDIAANLAFLKRRPAADLKPISDEDARHADELAQILHERTKKGNIANKSIAVLTEMLRTAGSIGQILDERAA
jgi:hypothetical protein